MTLFAALAAVVQHYSGRVRRRFHVRRVRRHAVQRRRRSALPRADRRDEPRGARLRRARGRLQGRDRALQRRALPAAQGVVRARRATRSSSCRATTSGPTAGARSAAATTRSSGCGSCASCSSRGDASLGQRPLALARQPERQRGAHDYPEHARWEHGGVLFVTLNAPGPDNNARAHAGGVLAARAAIRDWIEQRLPARARAATLKAVVVVMHANPWSAPRRPRRGFARAARGAGGRDAQLQRARCCWCTATRTSYRVDQPLRDDANGAAARQLHARGSLRQPVRELGADQRREEAGGSGSRRRRG